MAEPVAHLSICNHTHKRSLVTPSHMCSNVFSGVHLVRIIEVPDKRGPDNRGCTVVQPRVVLAIYTRSAKHE